MLPLALLLAAGLDPQTATVYTGIVAATAAESTSIDVVTADDLRHALDQEAARRSIGCADDTSCIAEIASAMGARLVLYGTAAQLDDELVVTLQLYDTATATGARRIARAVGRRELSDALATATRSLMTEYLERAPPIAGKRVRCIVLDLKGGGAPAPSSPPHVLTIVGVSAAAVGAVGVVAGVVIDLAAVGPLNAKARAPATSQIDAKQAFADRDASGAIALACYGIGGVLVIGGAVAAAISAGSDE
jgi:hypothetical protein